MSGHSKWSTIKRKKGALDAKRGQAFTKISKMITIAAQEGGGDPDMNFSLRIAVEKAKDANMPKDNIDRAIKKGLGEGGGEALVEMSYEGYGPDGVAVIVDAMTDNRNRTAAEIRHLFEGSGGSLGADGSVSWQFETKGFVIIKCKKIQKSEKFGKEDEEVAINKDECMLELMEVEGVDDVKEIDLEEEGIGLEIYSEKKDFAFVREQIEKLDYVIVSSEIIKVPTNPAKVNAGVAEKVQRFIDLMEENEDVQNVWVNLDLE